MLIILDTETTGTTPGKNEIYELAAVATTDDAAKVVSTFHRLMSVDLIYSEPAALKMSKYSRSELLSFPCSQKQGNEDFTEWLVDLMKAFPGKKFTMAGYNVNFDKDMLYPWFRRFSGYLFNYFSYYPLDAYPFICGLFHLGKIQSENLKLSSVCAALGIKLDNAHEALADVLATRKIISKFLIPSLSSVVIQ
jgi:DNA polymerase-3 subunit epsilon